MRHSLLFDTNDNIIGAFKKQFYPVISLIATAAQVWDHRKKVSAYKNAVAALGLIWPLLPMWGVNIALAHCGLVMVSIHHYSGRCAAQQL